MGMDLRVWLTFFAASWAISLSPGPGAIAAMSAGLGHGFRRGYFLTFGLVLGIATQVLVVGFGLGALIGASATAFAVLKWLGAGYLVFVGIQQWRAPAVPPTERFAPEHGAGTRGALVRRGWAVNATNPKGIAFLLAVVPPFIDPARALGLQYAQIGATIAFTDLVVMAGYTALAARVLGALRTPRQVRALNRTFGALFVGAGALLAGFERSD